MPGEGVTRRRPGAASGGAAGPSLTRPPKEVRRGAQVVLEVEDAVDQRCSGGDGCRHLRPDGRPNRAGCGGGLGREHDPAAGHEAADRMTRAGYACLALAVALMALLLTGALD